MARLDDSVLTFGMAQAAFLFLSTIVILVVPRHASVTRLMSLVPLSALTYMLQETFMELCRNPLWRATAAPLVWIQFLSASEMIWVSRVGSADISASRGESKARIVAKAVQTIALVWNLRRIGTRWQVKNIPASPSSGPASKSRARFVLKRLTTTLFAYLVLDIMISGPVPDSGLVTPHKQTLYKLDYLSMEDIIFRTIGTVSFWLSTALINLVMSNSVAIISVLAGLNSPTDCPPLYGPIGEAHSVRRFWG